MRKVTLLLLALTAIVTGLEAVATRSAKAENLVKRGNYSSETSSELTATAIPRSDRILITQLFYPPVTDPQALRVPGRGRASKPADTARLAFKIGTGASSESLPEGTLSYAQVAQAPVTRETLKPIVDAIAATGVPADAIQVKITEPRPSALPFPFPSTGSAGGAEVVVTIEQPTRDRLEKIVTAANQAVSKNKEISISSVDVQFSAKDCQALERTAYQTAVQDAQTRASAIAQAMGAKMRRVGSVAEPFYNAYLPGCDSQGNLPFGGDSAASYDPNAPIEVEVTKELFVTFPVE